MRAQHGVTMSDMRQEVMPASVSPVAGGAAAARAGRHSAAPGTHEHCTNCGTLLCGPWCHVCGQAAHIHSNLGALLHDLAHGVFHVEGKLWRTLPLLVCRPGELTRRYIHGERAKFVSPMALFLFSVFLLFAVVSHLAGHGHDVVAPATAVVGQLPPSWLGTAQSRRLAALEREHTAATNPAARQALDREIAGQQHAIGMSRGDNRYGVDFGISWLDPMIARSLANPDLVFYKVESYAYKYSWALIPISLPLVWLLFAFRRDVGLYDHAVFSIHSLAFMSMAAALLSTLNALGTPAVLIAAAAWLVPPLHMYRQLQEACRLDRFAALWRTLALLCITALAATVFLALLLYLGSD